MAALRTNDISPAFAAPYAAWNGALEIPLMEATNTMVPRPLADMARPAYFTTWKAWRTTMS